MMMSMFRVAGGNAFRASARVVSTANSRPYHKYSPCERSNLVEAIDGEIKVTELLRVFPAVPGDFPFKLKDSESGRRGEPNLSRKLGKEEISVRVREFVNCYGGIDHNNSVVDVDLKVEISKGDGKLFKFAVTASANEIAVNRLSVLIQRNEPDQMDYDVVCSQLYISPDCEMQFALREFLEKRGIQKSLMMGFVRDYLLWKTKLPMFSKFVYSPTRKFSQQNVEALTKLKEVIHDW